MVRHAWLILVALCAHAALAQPDDRASRVAPPQPAVAAERRIALVIGNSDYPGAPLRNPVNDARDMAAALTKAGFQVTLRENIGLRGMAEAIRAFGDAMQPDGVAVFYFAGHGVQVKDRNYLLPVDADIQREDEIPYATLDVNQVLDKMDRARSRVNIVILDACRNNPFVRSFRGLGQGLAQMEAPIGTLIAYATAPGKVALDGTGRNGIYTRHLLANIGRAGLAIELMFKRVREGVSTETKGAQTPWESSSLRGDFAFVSSKAAVAAARPAPQPRSEAFEAELAFWDSIKNSRSKADYEAYLQQYPQGHFAALARARIARPESRDPAQQIAAAPSTDVAKPDAKPNRVAPAPARPQENAPATVPSTTAALPPAAAPVKPGPALKYFSEPARNSSAVGFKLGDQFTGPGILTLGWLGAKKQVVLPAGEWVVLSAFDRDTNHTPPVNLVHVVFGRFAGERLAAIISVIANRTGSNITSWTDLDECERADPGGRLHEWKLPPSWQRQCMTIVFASSTLPAGNGPVPKEIRASLERMGASARGTGIVTTMLFSEKANGFMRIDRTDWPIVALGTDAANAHTWKTESQSAATPRGAYLRALIDWATNYRKLALEGFRRQHPGADLAPGVATPANSVLVAVDEFEPTRPAGR
jgi:uncharacterized caspase-like protein